MFNRLKAYLRNFDWILLSAVVLLLCFSLAEIYSVALGNDPLDLSNFRKQILFAATGLVLLFALSYFDYHSFRSYGNYLYIVGALSLLAVIFFGREIRGTRGWFGFPGFNIQPVEFAKIVLAVFLAKYFSGYSMKTAPARHFIVSGLSALCFVLLVLYQPDFGSALILFALWAGMVAVAGVKKRYLALIAAAVFVSFSAGWLFFFKDYQKQRVMTFLNPTADAMDRGYNITQAIIAVGSGRMVGRGIGFGSQSQLKFLPESQNDFIFAVIAEELGFLGVSLVLALFATVFYRLVSAARRTDDDFGIFLLLGASILIFIEMFINIGMNIGLLPVVGISLPFLSYGGSSIVASLMLIGLAESVIIRSRIKY